MKLFLITVNFNGTDDTRKLIESLDQQTDKDFELIIVDNASNPEQLRQLRSITRPWVTLLENTSNTGFSGGNNIGIRSALAQKAEWVVLLNNDTWIKPQFIHQVKAFISCRAGMLIALPIKEGDVVAYAGQVRWLAPTLPHIHHLVTSSYLKKNNGYVIGAGAAIHTSVFDRIGFLDERYFLYFEDADFSQRARKVGITTDIAPVTVYHSVSASTKKLGSPTLLRYHYRNMFLFNQLHAPSYIQIILPIWAFLGIIKQMLKLAVSPASRPESRAIYGGILDYLTGKFGKINVEDWHRVRVD